MQKLNSVNTEHPNTLGCHHHYNTIIVCVTLLIISTKAIAGVTVSVTKEATNDGSAFVAHIEQLNEDLCPFTISAKSIKDTNTVVLLATQPSTHSDTIRLSNELFHVTGSINEKQVCIVPAPFQCLTQLEEANGILTLKSLCHLALRQAINARHAIKLIDQLASTYGFSGKGGSITITGPFESWIMEIAGKGKKGKGIVWVAMKIPEGYLSVQTNISQIETFPLHNSATCMYSDDIFEFATTHLLNTKNKGELNFRKTFTKTTNVLTVEELKKWSIFARSAPSSNLSFQYPGKAKKYSLPLWIKPDNQLAIANIMALLRNHYEHTPIDTYSPAKHKNSASPYYGTNTPGLYLSNKLTKYNAVYQVRHWMPNTTGGIAWYSHGDSFFSIYTPLYPAIQELPRIQTSQTNGQLPQFLTNEIAGICLTGNQKLLDRFIYIQDSVEQQYGTATNKIDSIACQFLVYGPDTTITYLQEQSNILFTSTINEYEKFLQSHSSDSSQKKLEVQKQ